MRKSGVLMHITSLPGNYGIGSMGKNAYAFVDFLKAAGQSLWQILPLSPTGFGDSPYQSCSSYAGNPYLIDLDTLVQEGLLLPGEPEEITWSHNGRVDYGIQYNCRTPLLRKAYARFRGGEEFEAFRSANSAWLSDFCLFLALKAKTGGKPWYEWEDALKHRQADAIWNARQELQDEIRFYAFVQFLFFRQWNALHKYANDNGISIIGDVPIYVPLDSVDVWANPELFQLDEALAPTAVAGCPPDYFSEDGQLWGNPLYRYDVMKKDGFAWWVRRMAAAGNLYDVIRMDHFRGFEAYWSVPYGDATARNGKWIKGPGMDLISVLLKELPHLSFIAEDLGLMTPEVLALLADTGLPGMKVIGFAFDSREPSEYLPHNHVPNAVCYTGTHDNMTTRQWLENASPDALAYAKEYMCLNEAEGLVWGMIRTAMGTVCDTCIIPMPDYLNLGGEARMNFPGTLSVANWTWRAGEECLDPALAARIRNLTALYGRLPEQALNA